LVKVQSLLGFDIFFVSRKKTNSVSMCIRGPWYKFVHLLLEFGTVRKECHMLPKPWGKFDYKFVWETVDIEMPGVNYSHT
jgi:hypothetical protein